MSAVQHGRAYSLDWQVQRVETPHPLPGNVPLAVSVHAAVLKPLVMAQTRVVRHTL